MTFHKFPSNKDQRGKHLRRSWLKSIRRPDFDPTRYDAICNLHFENFVGPTTNSTSRWDFLSQPTLFSWNRPSGTCTTSRSTAVAVATVTRPGLNTSTLTVTTESENETGYYQIISQKEFFGDIMVLAALRPPPVRPDDVNTRKSRSIQRIPFKLYMRVDTPLIMSYVAIYTIT